MSLHRLQIHLIYILVGMFIVYFALDLAHYELSVLATGMFQTIWGVILLLIDTKGIRNKLTVRRKPVTRLGKKL